MKNRNRFRGVLVALIVLVLAVCVLPPLPKPKARAPRVTGVNRIPSFSATGTVALSGDHQGK